ncbi:uncharacterized protein A1O9_02705, partial [Exophiala aquamarina CBS 119918]
ALADASKDFGWSEKELRNRIAIWRGYDTIREAGGWVALAFAGMGLYRFCKYRLGFCTKNMTALRRLRSRFEVAADTIHPSWRQLLSVVGEQSTCVYSGHPCDWVWIPDFRFQHLEESIVDEHVWGATDPRTETQKDQYRLPGQFPCQKPFDRGVAIAEFVGTVTKNISDLDVMQTAGPGGEYQIWQGRQGNYTRFVNHSCQPNSQYERFFWLGSLRIVLVSKGISAGEEITVDYSNEYWKYLEKVCLCGESCCRFRRS